MIGQYVHRDSDDAVIRDLIKTLDRHRFVGAAIVVLGCNP